MFASITKNRRLLLPLDALFNLFGRVVQHVPIVLNSSKIYGQDDSCINIPKFFQIFTYEKALNPIRSGGGGL